jgi:hypothetical protein
MFQAHHIYGLLGFATGFWLAIFLEKRRERQYDRRRRESTLAACTPSPARPDPAIQSESSDCVPADFARMVNEATTAGRR